MNNALMFIFCLLAIRLYFIIVKFKSIGYLLTFFSVLFILIVLTMYGDVKTWHFVVFNVFIIPGNLLIIFKERSLFEFIKYNYTGISFLLILDSDKISGYPYYRVKSLFRKQDILYFMALLNVIGIFIDNNMSPKVNIILLTLIVIIYFIIPKDKHGN